MLGFANQQWEVTRVRFPEARSSMIKKLKEQNVYEVKIRLHGCGGDSPFSKPVRVTTGRLSKFLSDHRVWQFLKLCKFPNALHFKIYSMLCFY